MLPFMDKNVGRKCNSHAVQGRWGGGGVAFFFLFPWSAIANRKEQRGNAMPPDKSGIMYFIYIFQRSASLPAHHDFGRYFRVRYVTMTVRSGALPLVGRLSLAESMRVVGQCGLSSVAVRNLDVFGKRNGLGFALFRLEGDVSGPD